MESDPPQSHVRVINVFGYNVIVCDPGGHGVFGLDRRIGLWLSHFDESLVHGNHSFGGDE